MKIDISKILHGSSGEMKLDVDFSLQNGEFIAIAGQSGSGKTTLLRVLAGLEKADGKIEFNDEVWLCKSKAVAPQKRKIGFVFQDYALFPNMTVEENLLFVKKDREFANHLLEVTELLELKNRLPNTLSGGQKQRVSLCRAMMNRPNLLLMDEPLSALDPEMRAKLQEKILLLHKEFKITTIIVSHEPSEIYRLTSRVIVLSNGKVVSDTSPKELFLENSESNNFVFKAKIVDIKKLNKSYLATFSFGQQFLEIVLDKKEIEKIRKLEF